MRDGLAAPRDDPCRLRDGVAGRVARKATAHDGQSHTVWRPCRRVTNWPRNAIGVAAHELLGHAQREPSSRDVPRRRVTDWPPGSSGKANSRDAPRRLSTAPIHTAPRTQSHRVTPQTRPRDAAWPRQ